MAAKLVLDLHRRCFTGILLNHTPRCTVVNVPPTATGKRRFRKEVETDPHKLVNYCCGLNFVEGDPPVKLKPDEEYPNWLWELRLGPVPNSWDLQEGTKEYYLRLAAEEKQQNYLRRMTAGGEKKVVGKLRLALADYLHHQRFAALAHMEDDAGLELNSMESDWFLKHNQRIKMSDFYLPPDPNRVIYMDEVKHTTSRNYYYNSENTFKRPQRMKRHPLNELKAIQDSKRRHRYTAT